MSKIVDKYLELSKKVLDAAEAGKSADSIQNEMQEIKKQFSGDDWDELIHSSPVFMRPMISEQKNKHLKNRKPVK